MRAKLASMSAEERAAKLERARAMMQKKTPEQLERMRQLARERLARSKQAAEASKDEEKGVVKASDVVAGLKAGQVAPMPLEGTGDGPGLGSSTAAAPHISEMTTEQLMKRFESLPPQGKAEVFAMLTDDQKKSLEDAMVRKEPNKILLIFALRGNLERVRAAVEKGANVNYREEKGGDTILMLACWNKRTKVVEYLLENKADIKAENKNEQTAMHYASMKGDIPTVKVLLSRGAEVEKPDNKGYTPAICAAQFGHTALLEFYKRTGADLFHLDKEKHTLLHWTAYNKHALATTWVMNEGIGMDARDSRGRTAVHWAAKQGNTSILKVLVEHMDSDGLGNLLFEKDSEGRDPLELARYYENHAASGYLKDVFKRQRGCWAVWNRLTCAAGIRPGADMRTTAKAVSGWLIVCMAISWVHSFFCIRPYNDTIPDSAHFAFAVLVVMCYVFWFASNCTDPGWIKVGKGSSAEMNLAAGRARGRKTEQEAAKAARAREGDAKEASGPADVAVTIEMKDARVDTEDKDGSEGKEPAPWTKSYQELLEAGRLDLICVTCGIVRPLRSKHCRHCGRCVSRFDHHCPWIDNCVAEKNRRQFLGLAIFQTVSTWYYVVLCGMYLHQHTNNEVVAWLFTLLLMIHAMLVGSWGIMLTVEHINLAITNITTNEKINQYRYSYMRTPQGALNNPFNEGCPKNCSWFMGCRPATDWRKLNVNTKLLAPGKKGCNNPSHAHGTVVSPTDEKKSTEQSAGDAKVEAKLLESKSTAAASGSGDVELGGSAL